MEIRSNVKPTECPVVKNFGKGCCGVRMQNNGVRFLLRLLVGKYDELTKGQDFCWRLYTLGLAHVDQEAQLAKSEMCMGQAR